LLATAIALLAASMGSDAVRAQAPVTRAWLKERLEAAIAASKPNLGEAKIGILIYDLAQKQALYELEGETLFNVASNTKIPTAAAALALLGPDFRYRTGAYAQKLDDRGTVSGDLYLRGRGDPSFGSQELYELARRLASAGVRRISGGLVIDDTYFDAQNLPPHFEEQPKEEASFRAPIGATSLNFNQVAVIVRPARSARGAAAVHIDPPNSYVQLAAQVTTVVTGRTRLRVDTKLQKGGMLISVSGQIRGDGPERVFRRRVADPVQYMGAAFARALAQNGVKLGKKGVRSGATPAEARALAVRESEPLAILVHGLGKFSNNYVAEMLLKTIGAELKAEGKPASWEHGLGAVREFLTKQIGLAEGSFRYENGSGLFASNAFSPRALVAVLAAAYRDFRWGPDFLSSFSIAGADGTLSARMVGGAAERQVRAKTGTLGQVSALSGYAALDGRAPLVFSILINGFPPEAIEEARSLQDRVSETLVEYLRNAR
jgi:D-alanyl-D-alanine carboxypeptidase/D-alanyl-D-alanine-endopeptidase (penicillin-binding protein 4)